MLTKLIVRNFKRFDEVEIPLANPVVLIGPNNSGKTTAMQALTLWELARREWNGRALPADEATGLPGATLNRLSLTMIPTPEADTLWRNRRSEDALIEIIVEGEEQGVRWSCGFAFEYANEESLYAHPIRLRETPFSSDDHWTPVPAPAQDIRCAFLSPSSGLIDAEVAIPPGAVNVRIGQGRTAEILRNLCYTIYLDRSDLHPNDWPRIVERIGQLFGVELDPPRYLAERGEILMTYRQGGVQLDLTAAGRGLHQTLLLLAHLTLNRGSVLLLDEPDAHLEVLRQRQTYRLLSETAQEHNSQLVIASHSEVILNEAAGKDTVVAFVGTPYVINQHSAEVAKSLEQIGWDQYAQALQIGWVLYLEGSTDRAMLEAFAKRLGHHAALEALEHPFIHYVGNNATAVRSHFFGLREAKSDLAAVALFDRPDGGVPKIDPIRCLTWRRREIENYICTPGTLIGYAQHDADHMRDAISEIEAASRTLGQRSIWSAGTKASEDALPHLLRAFERNLGRQQPVLKRDFHQLVQYLPDHDIDPEVTEKLDAIAEVAARAQTRS